MRLSAVFLLPEIPPEDRLLPLPLDREKAMGFLLPRLHQHRRPAGEEVCRQHIGKQLVADEAARPPLHPIPLTGFRQPPGSGFAAFATKGSRSFWAKGFTRPGELLERMQRMTPSASLAAIHSATPGKGVGLLWLVRVLSTSKTASFSPRSLKSGRDVGDMGVEDVGGEKRHRGLSFRANEKRAWKEARFGIVYRA